MTERTLKEMVQQIESWPLPLQEELVEIAREMDEAHKGGLYHPTPEELVGIERGLADADAGRFASDAEVRAVFTSRTT